MTEGRLSRAAGAPLAALLFSAPLGVSAEFETLPPGATLSGVIEEADLRNPAAGHMDEITLRPGSAEALTVTAHSETADLVLEVLSPDGRRWMNDDDDRSTVNPRVTVTFEGESDHLIRVFGLTPNDLGPYTLTVESP